jgi:hypothetical protein
MSYSVLCKSCRAREVGFVLTSYYEGAALLKLLHFRWRAHLSHSPLYGGLRNVCFLCGLLGPLKTGLSAIPLCCTACLSAVPEARDSSGACSSMSSPVVNVRSYGAC